MAHDVFDRDVPSHASRRGGIKPLNRVRATGRGNRTSRGTVSCMCLLAGSVRADLFTVALTHVLTKKKERSMAPRLNVIIGSTRPGRVGPVVAKWFEGFARQHAGFEPVLVDLDEFRLPVYDEPKHPRTREYQKEHTGAWSASVA